MRKRPEIWRRAEAAAVSAVILWAIGVTAGSESASAAWKALAEAWPLRALRWELGDLRPRDELSPAAAAALAEAPLLLSARPEVAELWRQAEEPADGPAGSGEEPLPVPVEETPLDAAAPDNGVPARTLVPTDPTGYTVCGRVYISSTTDYTPSPEELRKPFAAELTEEGPQILILHTHGSEAYTPAEGTDVVWSGDHRTTDSRYNVVNAGDVMADALAEAGVSVLHDRTLYDYPNYSGAYDRSLAAIQRYLAEYPSIRFVLDVHRDAIEDGEGNEYKVVSEIEGMGTAAQMSLVIGSDGSGLTHPHWMENLKLAAAVQESALEDYPTLMRPVLLRNSRYNQHATTGSLLIEVGAAGNSPEEAALAARLFAGELLKTLKNKEPEPEE